MSDRFNQVLEEANSRHELKELVWQVYQNPEQVKLAIAALQNILGDTSAPPALPEREPQVGAEELRNALMAASKVTANVADEYSWKAQAIGYHVAFSEVQGIICAALAGPAEPEMGTCDLVSTPRPQECCGEAWRPLRPDTSVESRSVERRKAAQKGKQL